MESELTQGGMFVRFHAEDDGRPVRLWMDENHTLLHIDDSEPVQLLDVVDVRYGCETDVFLKILKGTGKNKYLWQKAMDYALWLVGRKRGVTGPKLLSPTCCFSVVYVKDNRHQTLDLQAEDTETTLQWCRELKLVVDQIRQHQQAKDNRDWLRTKFLEADTNRSGALDWKETCHLLTQLNTKKSDQDIRILFDLANTNKVRECGQQVLDFEEFLGFYELLVQRPEISSIYQQYATGPDGFMNADGLRNFLVAEQSEKDPNVNEEIGCYEPNESVQSAGKLSLEGFSRMLKSRKFDVLDPTVVTEAMDMDQPLCDYYICSSHNTYLEGNQLVGRSTIEGYISALEKGCRCIELDLWDGPDGEAVIYHGHTLTTEILAEHVLRHAIAPYAFKYSDYPLILSVESHLSAAQQDTFADCLRRELGDMLCKLDTTDMDQLPSPNQLKHQIIVKTDVTKPMTDKFAALQNVCQQVRFDVADQSRQGDRCFHVTGLSEMEAKGHMLKSAADMIEHGERQLNRVYPFGLRVQSGNFDPLPFWNCGLQMVALNVQTGDEHLTTNLGRFRAAGNIGYVLKPKEAIRKTALDLSSVAPVLTLRLRIISGQNLPKETKVDHPVSPYVSVQVRGHSADDSPLFTTETVRDNGLNPCWDSRVFQCSVKVPELAMLSFTVCTLNGILAAFALPVLSLAPGYRHVALNSPYGIPLPVSSLFIHSAIDVHQ